MLNTLSAQAYDVLGHVSINVLPSTQFQYVERRVSRSRTLDGGAVINDGGYSPADRVIEISWATVDSQHHQSVERLVQLYPLLVVSTDAGVFLAAPDRYTPGPEESTLRLLVQSKLSS